MSAAAGTLTSPVTVAGQLAARSVRLLLRQPSAFVPSLVFPIITTIAFSGAFSALTMLPGFPTDEMINWMLPMSVVQGAAFAGVGVGMGLVRDLENGFYDRLILAPAHPAGLLAGPVVAAEIRAFGTVVIVMAAGLAGGADMPGGVLGLVVLLVGSLGTALAASLWAIGLGLRIKTVQAGSLMQVGIFVAVFLSTGQVPLSVMTGWLRVVAGINPMTEVLELSRQGFIGDVTWRASYPGLLAILVLSISLAVFAARSFRKLIP